MSQHLPHHMSCVLLWLEVSPNLSFFFVLNFSALSLVHLGRGQGRHTRPFPVVHHTVALRHSAPGTVVIATL